MITGVAFVARAVRPIPRALTQKGLSAELIASCAMLISTTCPPAHELFRDRTAHQQFVFNDQSRSEPHPSRPTEPYFRQFPANVKNVQNSDKLNLQ